MTKMNDILGDLRESEQLFRQRKLTDARQSVRRVLDSADPTTARSGLMKANLLMGMIENVCSQYEGGDANFDPALQYIRKAHELYAPDQDNGQEIDILMAFGRIHINQSEWSLANTYFQKALTAARQQENKRAEIIALCALSQTDLREQNLDEAFEKAQQAEEYLSEPSVARDDVLRMIVFNQLASVYHRRRDIEELAQYSEQLLELSQQLGDAENEINALNNLAYCKGVQSDYVAAMTLLSESLKKSRTIGFRYHVASCQINIGIIYALLFNYKEAQQRYEIVLEDFTDILPDKDLLRVYNNVGYIHYHNEDYSLAESYFKKALALARQSDQSETIAHTLAQMSRAKAARNQLDEAFDQAIEAHDIMKPLGTVNGKQFNELNLGFIYLKKEQYDKAIKHTSQGIVASKYFDDAANESKGYQLLAMIYQQQGNFEKALQYQMIFARAQEKFASLQKHHQVIDTEIRYTLQEKKNEIEQLTRENQFQALLLQQSDQIAQQNIKLLQVNEELRQFAYVASHDLKEPLRMIGSYAQLIKRKHGASFDEDSLQYFQFLSEGVTRMNHLLDALLRYATIGKNQEEVERVNLKDVIDIAIINLRVRIEETGAEINVSDLPQILSSQSLLIQLFQNLISNAIKFRKPEQKPVVDINWTEQEDQVTVIVRDNGIGIAREYQERIFVIFQRLHNRKLYEGTGIGLAICLKIIQRVGGQIRVESEEGEGATFYVSLPKKMIPKEAGI